MKNKIDYLILRIVFVLTLVFVIGYCSYPVIIPHIVSVEQANKSNVEKFENNRCFFQEVIDTCTTIHLKQLKTYITIDDIPKKIQRRLNHKGIYSLEARIETKNGEITIIADFHTAKFWYNDVLNHVIINYSSHRRFDKCNNNDSEFKARMSSICLENGWFFDVDTDWL